MPRRITVGRAWQVIGMGRAGLIHSTGPSITFVLELVQVDPRKPQSKMTGFCTACANTRFKSTRSLRDQWHRCINLRVSCSTVNRRLLSRGLNSRRPAKKPLLTRERKTTRLEWARQHQHRGMRHWRHVVFSDESRHLLHRASDRDRLRPEAGQRFQLGGLCLPSVAHGGQYMFGVVIHYGGRSNLVILERNITADTRSVKCFLMLGDTSAGTF